MPQYFTGKKASGYIIIQSPDLPNGKVELETRMCAHCNAHFLYAPGNAKKYLKYMPSKNFINGICMQCFGLTCMKRTCNERCETLEKKLENYEKDKSLTLA